MRFLSSPAVWNGAVYFGSGDGNVYALDAASGKLKWRFATGNVAHSSPELFFGTSIRGLVHAVDAKTDAEVFTLDTQFPVFASIMISNGALYFGALDGNLTAVDLKTQNQFAFFRTTLPSRTCRQSRMRMEP